MRCPVAGRVKTRLSPPLSPEQACDLYRAFLADLGRRLERPNKYSVTVFYEGGEPECLDGLVPARATLEPQRGAALGERLVSAFDHLLSADALSGPAVVIGSDSPDLPLSTLKRAFRKLKHHDVALGPAADGGYYLVGLRQPQPALFDGISWGTDSVLAQTLAAVEREGLTLATLPLWYDVDSAAGLRALRESVAARRIEGRDRLVAIERALEAIGPAAD